MAVWGASPQRGPGAEPLAFLPLRWSAFRDVTIEPAAMRRLAAWQAAGYGHLPVFMAKTQYSFSGDAKALGAPADFVLAVRDVRLSAGAGFVVALCGDILTMPGLPRVPAANAIRLDAGGMVEGLF